MKLRLARDHRLRLFAAIVVLATAVWSFASLHDLAHTLGFVKLALLFPLCVDAVAAFGMDVWMSRGPAWRLGRRLALGAIAVSILGNVADWVLNLADWRSAVLSAIPPVMMAATLLVLHRHYAAAPLSQVTPMAPPESPAPVAPEAPTAPVPPKVRPSGPKPTRPQSRATRSDQELVAQLLEHHRETGDLPTRRAAMTLLGVGTGRVTALLRQARDQLQGREAA